MAMLPLLEAFTTVKISDQLDITISKDVSTLEVTISFGDLGKELRLPTEGVPTPVNENHILNAVKDLVRASML